MNPIAREDPPVRASNTRGVGNRRKIRPIWHEYAVKSCPLVNDCEFENLPNTSRLAERSVGNICTSVREACQRQLRFLFVINVIVNCSCVSRSFYPDSRKKSFSVLLKTLTEGASTALRQLSMLCMCVKCIHIILYFILSVKFF